MAIKSENSQNPVLFGMLKNLRNQICKDKGIQAYDVFVDTDLETFVTMQLTTPEDFMFAFRDERKLQRFGERFMDVIRFYKERQSGGAVPPFVQEFAVTMSKFLEPINVMLKKQGAKPIATHDVTEELMALGYLKKQGIPRVATDRGMRVGMENKPYDDNRKNNVLYDGTAQLLVLGLLYEMRLLP